MPRSGKIKTRTNQPDPIYNSRQVSLFINRLMKDGKKQVAAHHLYKAFTLIENKLKKEPLEVFYQALENAKPQLEVRSRRVGGAAYQIPVPVKGERKESLAIRWLIFGARNRSSKEHHSFSEKLAQEIIDASQNIGSAIKKKEDTHRMADANKAFAHFRW